MATRKRATQDPSPASEARVHSAELTEDGKAPAGGDIAATARKRFAQGQSFYAAQRVLAASDIQFVMGDSDNGYQWPGNFRRARESDKRVTLTINTTAQHCNQIINDIRARRPAVKISPADDKADKRTAELISGLIRNIHAASQADIAHDTGAEFSIYGGEGYWRVLTEYESPTSFNQRIVVRPIMNPMMVLIDPMGWMPDRSNAKWGFVFEDIEKDEFERKYPHVDCASWSTEFMGSGWFTENTVRVADYYWCDYIDDEAWFLDDGSTMFGSEAKKAGIPRPADPKRVRKTQRVQWRYAKLGGGETEPLEERDWPGKLLPIISCIGKEVNAAGEVIRKGLVRDVKDPARMVNYSYSEAVQTIAVQNKSPYLAAAEAIEGWTDEWKNANRETPIYLPWNAYNENGDANPKPERQTPPTMPIAQINLLQISTEQMRAASGQQNANFGIKSEAQSGVGIQRLKVQGDTATFHFPDNLRRALHYEARVIIDLIQQVYDTERVVRILGLDGEVSTARIDPDQAVSYDEVALDATNAQAAGAGQGGISDAVRRDIERVFNPMVGEFDIVIDTGPSFSTQRQEAFANLNEAASRSPQMLPLVGDVLYGAADFPGAEKLSRRFERMLPPEARDDNDPVSQMQGQMQQMQQVIQQGTQENQRLAQELEKLRIERAGRVIETQGKIAMSEGDQRIDAFRAETDRMAALAPAAAMVDPALIQAVVMQTLQALLANPTPDGGAGPAPGPQMAPPGPPMQPGAGVPLQPMNPMPRGPVPSGAMPPDAGLGPPTALTGGMPGPGPAA